MHCESTSLSYVLSFHGQLAAELMRVGLETPGKEDTNYDRRTGAGSYYLKALVGQSTRQGKMGGPRACPANKELMTANKDIHVVIPLWAAHFSQGWNVWKMSRLLAAQENLPPVGERFQKFIILLLVPGPLPKSRHILVTSGKATFFPQQKNKSTQHSDQQMASRENINDPPAEARCWHKVGCICRWLTVMAFLRLSICRLLMPL